MTNAAGIAGNTVEGPDFRHVESWIFDLDNTLYPASSDLFALIDTRMTDYVQALLGLDRQAARALQKTYYRDHGTTLNGLMRLHGVDPEDFLLAVHDIALDALDADPHLLAAIARLPGRRFVFTNGCRHYAGRVLARLGIEDQFEAVWDIRTIAFRPKPAEEAYREVLSAYDIDPQRAVMFEDVARNLVPAHGLGMTTVWLRNGSEWSKQGPTLPVAEGAHIHYEIDNLADFLHSLRIAP